MNVRALGGRRRRRRGLGACGCAGRTAARDGTRARARRPAVRRRRPSDGARSAALASGARRRPRAGGDRGGRRVRASVRAPPRQPGRPRRRASATAAAAWRSRRRPCSRRSAAVTVALSGSKASDPVPQLDRRRACARPRARSCAALGQRGGEPRRKRLIVAGGIGEVGAQLGAHVVNARVGEIGRAGRRRIGATSG